MELNAGITLAAKLSEWKSRDTQALLKARSNYQSKLLRKQFNPINRNALVMKTKSICVALSAIVAAMSLSGCALIVDGKHSL